MPISTIADAKDLLISRDLNPIRVRDGWEVNGQVLSGPELLQLARQLDSGKTTSKYGNRRVSYDGRTFHSVAECEHYKTLKLQEAAGEISDLECQPRFELLPGFRDWEGKRHHPTFYVADFSYKRNGRIVVEDVKGMKTDAYAIKVKFFLSMYPHVEFHEVSV
jgi:hypothetical protein